VRFRDSHQGTHTARFGEIEQRGVALTHKGRELYDRLLAQAGSGSENQQHQHHLSEIFAAFPDDEASLRQQQLAWFEYRRTAAGENLQITPDSDIESLLAQGVLKADPIIYEDFLPVSAAGIFQSNLGSESKARSQGQASRQQFEQALGTQVHDEIELYAQRERSSKLRCGLL